MFVGKAPLLKNPQGIVRRLVAPQLMGGSVTCPRRGRMRHALTVAMMLILLPLASASSQEPIPPVQSRAVAVRTLGIGQRVRLDVVQLGRVQGVVFGINESELTLTDDAELKRIALPEIQRLWVRGRATKTGVLVGSVAGLIAGLAYGFLIGEVACAETDCTRTEVAAIVGLVSGAGGAVVGGSIGLVVHKWHLRFP